MSDTFMETQMAKRALLSKLNLPSWLQEEIAETHKREESVAHLKSVAQKCDDSTNQAITILKTILNRVNALNTVINPLYQKSKRVVTAQSNIKDTLVEVRAISDTLNLQYHAEKAISMIKVHSDYDAYLGRLRNLQTTYSFWQRNQSIKHSDKYIRHLREVINNAVSAISEEFERLLILYTKPIDSLTLTRATLSSLQTGYIAVVNPLNNGGVSASVSTTVVDLVELVPSAISTRLGMLISGMEQIGNRHFLPTLIKVRTVILKATIKKLITDALDHVIEIPELYNSTQTKVYTRASHSSLFFIEALQYTFEREAALWNSLLRDTGVDSEEFDDAFGRCQIGAMESFAKRVDTSLQPQALRSVPNTDQQLIGLDIQGYLNLHQTRLRNTLKKTKEFPDHMVHLAAIKSIAQQIVRDSLKSLIVDGVSSGDQSTSTTSKDATICAMTVETTTLLAKLNTEYTDVQNLVSVDDIVQPLIILNPELGKAKLPNKSSALDLRWLTKKEKGMGWVSLDEAQIWAINNGLEHRLILKAHHLGKNTPIRHLFLLNNFFHVQSTTLQRAVIKRAAFHDHMQEITSNARKAYHDTTWKVLLEGISIDKKDTILSHCNGEIVPPKYKPVIKKLFTNFNTEFKRILEIHKKYAVPDVNLRGQLKADHVDLIVPPYRAFLATYGSLVFTSKSSKYFEFTAEAIEDNLGKFYLVS